MKKPQKKPPSRCTSQLELAGFLGFSDRALKNWIKDPAYDELRPTKAPNGGYKIADWQAWSEYHGLESITRISGPIELEGSEDKRLKTELLRIKVEQEKAKLALITGESVSRDLVAEVWTRNHAIMCRDLLRIFKNEMPPKSRGLTEKQMSVLFEDAILELMEGFASRGEVVADGE